MPKAQKTGPLMTFRVINAETGRAIRNDDLEPLKVKAYTAKAARHTIKKIVSVPFKMELA